MKCNRCGEEMRRGFLFSTKDGAFSFANEVPSAFSDAKNSDGFVKITSLKLGGRTNLEANICESCHQIVIEY